MDSMPMKDEAGSPRVLTPIGSIGPLRTRLAAARAEGHRIGFVPTMGALHAGHASLIDRARDECELVVASIFVNPLQFGPGEDLDAYPRTMDADRALLSKHGCDILFSPDVSVLYSGGFQTRVVQQADLTQVLCGRSREGHFDGVLTVVLKLFNIVQPDRAYFGQKDYQQALVIQRMVEDLDVPVDVRVCPIVREPDGLARSSRNRYLGAEERRQATALHDGLVAMERQFQGGERRVAELLNTGRKAMAGRPLVRLEYLELRDPRTLSSRADEAREGDLVAVAARVGPARLIDNALLGGEGLA